MNESQERIRARRGERLPNIEHSTKNMTLRWIRKKKDSKTLNIVGEGKGLDAECYGWIKKHDRNLYISTEDDYESLRGDILGFYFPVKRKHVERTCRELAEFINKKCEEYSTIVFIGYGKSIEYFLRTATYLNRTVRIATISDVQYYKKIVLNIEKCKNMSMLKRYQYKKKHMKQIDYIDINRCHRWINFESTYKEDLNKKELQELQDLEEILLEAKEGTRVKVASKCIHVMYEVDEPYDFPMQTVLDYFRD